MLVAWRPSELQGYVSRYFQSNLVGLSQPYSHASLLVVHNGNVYHCEAAIDGLDVIKNFSLEKFVSLYGNHADFYELMPIELGGEQVLDNIAYVTYTQQPKPTSYAALYRALIGFNRDDTAVCTSYVLDCLGIESERYHTVLESIIIASHYYYLLNVYGN